ncbi:MAG: hypothetical protein RBS37_12505 [Bacteroidales bacterium]|jgi:hypothetical protein|nr:hypothetical protein [Bacteroidales bacterium]
MKTITNKDKKRLALILLAVGCLHIGYVIGRQFWVSDPFNPMTILPGILCLLFASLIASGISKQEKAEDKDL